MGQSIPKGYINDRLYGQEIWYIRNAGKQDIIFVEPIEFKIFCEREIKGKSNGKD